MNTDHKLGWTALKTAEKEFKEWAASTDILLHCVHHVATFEPWDDQTDVCIFFKTEAALETYKIDGTVPTIEDKYRKWLAAAGYPFDKWPVVFFFDSHENVVKNYEGSYFYRLR